MSGQKNMMLSNIVKDYLEELELYNQVVQATALNSMNQHGIKTDGRGMRAMKIFTRQTLTALSLAKLFPEPSPFKDIDEDLWDINSIASLTRNLMEGYISLYYFGTEIISESEAELRFYLLQLHKSIEWYNIRKVELDDKELKQFEEGIADQKARLKNHPYLPQLSSDEKKRVFQWKEMYKTKADFEARLPICKDLRRIYRHLSNLVHPVPLSVERTDNDRGRGMGKDSDVNYCLICVMLARKYLAATLISIVDHFKKDLADKFQDEVAPIRPLMFKGFP